MKSRTLLRWARIEAAFALLKARLAIRLLSTKRLLAWADKPPAKTSRFLNHEVPLVRWAVDNIGERWWMRANCLPRALAAKRMLRKRGITGKLCLGVARDSNGLSAHAWIELQQEMIVGGLDAPRFTRIVEFEGRAHDR